MELLLMCWICDMGKGETWWGVDNLNDYVHTFMQYCDPTI